MEDYKKIRDELNTGDIILFSGTGKTSNAIKYFTMSKFSHVGMIIRDDLNDIISVFESRGNGGVQINFLSNRLEPKYKEIAIRKLKSDGLFPAKKFRKFRQEYLGRPYEDSKKELIKSAYDGPFGHNDEDLSSIFCSELIAECFQYLGYLGEHKSSNEYTPKDFSQEKMNLLSGAYLENEITIYKS